VSPDEPVFSTEYAVRLPDGQLASAPQGNPWMWDHREGADRALDSLRGSAAAMGIHDYSGQVVHRLCTQFIDADSNHSKQLVDELQAWLRNQGGQAK
jgi:hypothetical protein